MFGLTFEKLLLIGVLAVFLLGPERLPHYAAQFARLVKSLKKMADGAKDRMREEMGPDFDDVDWKKLDPRQYDPRRIIREALVDDVVGLGAAAGSVSSSSASSGSASSDGAAAGAESAYQKRKRLLEEEGKTAPFDAEAT